MDLTPRRPSGSHTATPHCGQHRAPRVSAAAHIPARVAATHLDAGGKAAIAHLWAEHKARRDQLRLQAMFEACMRAVRFGATPSAVLGTGGNAWVDPVIHPGERA